MAKNARDNPIGDHYIQVQALTPIPGQVQPTPETSTKSLLPSSFNYVSTSIIVFIAMMVVGSLALIVTKARNINRLLVLLLIAFTTSAIPLTLQTVSNQTSYQSQADLSQIPELVMVDNVTPTSFMVKWHTDKTNIGSIRLGSTQNFSQYTRVIDQIDTKPTNQHIVVVNDLQPNTVYYFVVLSGGTWYDQSGQPLTITTPF